MYVRIDPEAQTVEIGGTDVSEYIRRTTIDMHKGRQAEVFLELSSGAFVPEAFQVDGIVHVIRGAEDMDPGPIVAAWLATVDPGDLERAALEEGDMTTGPGQTFLEILQRMATGG